MFLPQHILFFFLMKVGGMEWFSNEMKLYQLEEKNMMRKLIRNNQINDEVCKVKCFFGCAHQKKKWNPFGDAVILQAFFLLTLYSYLLLPSFANPLHMEQSAFTLFLKSCSKVKRRSMQNRRSVVRTRLRRDAWSSEWLKHFTGHLLPY